MLSPRDPQDNTPGDKEKAVRPARTIRRVAAAAAALVAATAAVVVGPTPAGAAGSTPVQIRNLGGTSPDHCLGVEAQEFGLGAPIRVVDCADPTGASRLLPAPGPLTRLDGRFVPTFALEVAGGVALDTAAAPSIGTPVVLHTYNGSASQLWAFRDGMLVNLGGGLALTATGNAIGSTVVLGERSAVPAPPAARWTAATPVVQGDGRAPAVAATTLSLGKGIYCLTAARPTDQATVASCTSDSTVQIERVSADPADGMIISRRFPNGLADGCLTAVDYPIDIDAVRFSEAWFAPCANTLDQRFRFESDATGCHVQSLADGKQVTIFSEPAGWDVFLVTRGLGWDPLPGC